MTDSGGDTRDHSSERRHYGTKVHSLSGIAGGGEMTVGVDDGATIREHGFEKRHYEEADEAFVDAESGEKPPNDDVDSSTEDHNDSEKTAVETTHTFSIASEYEASPGSNDGAEQEHGFEKRSDEEEESLSDIAGFGKGSFNMGGGVKRYGPGSYVEKLDSHKDEESGPEVQPRADDGEDGREHPSEKRHYTEAALSLSGIAGDDGAAKGPDFRRRHFNL